MSVICTFHALHPGTLIPVWPHRSVVYVHGYPSHWGEGGEIYNSIEVVASGIVVRGDNLHKSVYIVQLSWWAFSRQLSHCNGGDNLRIWNLICSCVFVDIFNCPFRVLKLGSPKTMRKPRLIMLNCGGMPLGMSAMRHFAVKWRNYLSFSESNNYSLEWLLNLVRMKRLKVCNALNIYPLRAEWTMNNELVAESIFITKL